MYFWCSFGVLLAHFISDLDPIHLSDEPEQEVRWQDRRLDAPLEVIAATDVTDEE